jgi:hypothetical protein
VSPSDNNEKSSVKKTPKASIGSDGRYYGEIGESQELTELKTPRQITKKEEFVKKSVVEKFQTDKKQPDEKKAEAENTETESEGPADVFDDDGNIIETEQALNIKIAELKKSIALKFSALFEGIKERLEGPFNKVKSINLKIFGGLLFGFIRVFSSLNLIFLKLLRIKKAELIPPKVHQEKEEIKELAPEELFIRATFNDMADLNVLFTDNYDTPLYKKKKTGSQDFSKAENIIMMLNAIDAIKQCAEFTKDVPPVKEGFYRGTPVIHLMTNVTEQDVSFFLGYVKAKPKKYIGKSWKISETFATWLVANAPMAELKK